MSKEKKDNLNDFGFTVYNEAEILRNENEEFQKLEQEIERLKIIEGELKKNADEAMRILQPFFDNLINAPGDIIKWPRDKRKEVLTKQRNQLQLLLWDNK